MTANVQFALSTLTIAQGVLTDFKQHPKLGPLLREKGKRGGYFCVAELDYGIYTTTLIGTHPINKGSTYDVVMKKAQFLLQNPGRLMSREGRDPSHELWGGGLRIPDTPSILAFSGFPEHLDELFVMACAARMNLLSRFVAIELLQEFPNDYAKPEEDNLVFL